MSLVAHRLASEPANGCARDFADLVNLNGNDLLTRYGPPFAPARIGQSKISADAARERICVTRRAADGI